MEQVPLKSLWAQDTIVLTFFRRFGWLFCRQAAKELSSITPLLQAHNVKNIGVGLEELGLDDFVKGQYFNGDLYVDVGKKTYEAIGYKKYGFFEMMSGFFTKAWKDKAAKVNLLNIIAS